MNNKALIFIGAAVVIIVGLFYIRGTRLKNEPGVSNDNTSITNSKNSESLSQEDINNRNLLMASATLTVPDTDQKVSFAGEEQAEWGDTENREDAFGFVFMGNHVTKLPDGNLIAEIAVNSGGNADAIYIMVFEPGEASWIQSDSEYLETGIDVNSITVNDNKIVVSYNSYGPEQAMAEKPNTPSNVEFNYSNGKLDPIK